MGNKKYNNQKNDELALQFGVTIVVWALNN